MNLDSRFTLRERQVGELVAVLLWGLSVAALVALATWSVAPGSIA